ncbi:YraN family protein [Myxococcota bacterium]|nr:YraN family protein [Myxococcota bacterium]
MGSQETGRQGEEAVVRWLRRRGHVVLARNHRAAGGELDIVSRRGGAIYFIEVRTRAAGAMVEPGESVDSAKRNRLIAAARSWLRGSAPHDRSLLAVAAVRPGWLGWRVELTASAFDAPDSLV